MSVYLSLIKARKILKYLTVDLMDKSILIFWFKFWVSFVSIESGSHSFLNFNSEKIRVLNINELLKFLV